MDTVRRLQQLLFRLWRATMAHWGIVAVVVVALVARLIYLHWFKAFPEGDVFNFINLARALPSGSYPITEKRLPFYPLLMLLLKPFFDWEVAGMLIAISASVGAVILLYGIGRQLGFSKTALAATLLLFQAQPFYMIASTRQYADTTVIALTLAGLLMLLTARTWKGAVFTGLLFGMAALTRYEGLAAALIALPLWLMLPRGLPRRLPMLAIVAFCITLLPYAALAVANNRPLFGAGYILEAQKPEYGVMDLYAIRDNAIAIWERVGLTGFWHIPYAIYDQLRDDPITITRGVFAPLLTSAWRITSLFASIGLVALLFRRWKEWLFVTAIYAGVTAAPAWYQPYPRFDTFILPAAAIFAAGGLTALQQFLERGTSGKTGRYNRVTAGLLLVFLASGVWTMQAFEELRSRQTKHNGRNYAYYLALREARQKPGPIGVVSAPGIVRAYFGEENFYNMEDELKNGPEAVVRNLQEKKVQYVVIPGHQSKKYAFLLADPRLQVVKQYEWPEINREIGRATLLQVR